MMSSVWLYICLFICGTSASAFSSAQDARTKMEDMVKNIVASMEGSYVDIASEEGGAKCPYVDSCSHHEAFDSATQNVQFNNPTTGTCTRFDKDSSNYAISSPETGRNFADNALPTSCNRATFPSWSTYLGSDTCKCQYQIIDYSNPTNLKLHKDTLSKVAYLDQTGCTKDSDKTKCTVNEQNFGANLPGEVSWNNARVQGEICATQQLVKPHFQKNAAAHSDIKWQFMGMQDTGMYRNWPAIYQCRTENQCSGCSDPRFRSWYASSASGPKDVVLVLDTSGSMKTADRISKMKKAAGWVINTLSENDHAQVVSFSGSATSQGTKLLRMDTVGRAYLKQFIAELSAFGSTNMGSGIDKAFDILQSSRQSGQSSKCTSAVLFLTDGENSGAADPEERFATLNAEINANIFTYSFGANADTSGMQSIACAHKGVWQLIPDTASATQVSEIMAGYFKHFAAGISHAPLRWSDWFEDGQGLGQIAAACASVYDRTKEKREGVAVLFGVICQAIHKDTWDALGDASTVWKTIKTANAKCETPKLSENQLEIIRGAIHPDSTCTASGRAQACAREGATCDPVGASAGAIGGSVIALLLVCAGGFAFSRMRKQRLNQPGPAPGSHGGAVVVPAQGMVMAQQAQYVQPQVAVVQVGVVR